MVNNHFAENKNHFVHISLADGSFWCYKCDSYLEHPILNHNKQDLLSIKKAQPEIEITKKSSRIFHPKVDLLQKKNSKNLDAQP